MTGLRSSVAALYVDANGIYPKLLGPENCWDETRDARLYDGPHPVVAHPPCGPWGRLRHLYTGGESDCAVRAVAQVRQFGGVLEHPAQSTLWVAGLELPRPGYGDRFGGYTIETDQVEWGHVCRKRTWIYCVGVPSLLNGYAVSALRPPPYPGRKPTHWASGGRTKSSRKGSPAPEGIKIASAQQRRRTPIAFAQYLISLADAAGQARVA